MKIKIIPPKPKYSQVAAQQLRIGEAVQYPAGNGVIRLNSIVYLEYDIKGNFIITDGTKMGHGAGDLLPEGTELWFTL